MYEDAAELTAKIEVETTDADDTVMTELKGELDAPDEGGRLADWEDSGATEEAAELATIEELRTAEELKLAEEVVTAGEKVGIAELLELDTHGATSCTFTPTLTTKGPGVMI
jgi:hypothetical protein